MIYNNNTITAITYSGYDIVRAYSCEDKLVFGNEPSPHEHVKIHMYFEDGGEDIIVNCNSSGELTNYEVFEAEIQAGRRTMWGATHVNIGDCTTEVEHNLLAWTAASQSNETLTSVTVANTVTKIGYSFCQGRTALKYVNLPSTIKTLEAYSFYECKSLPEFRIKDGVEIIENNVFDDCTSLFDIVIPNTVTSIGNGAFAISNGTELINEKRKVTILATTPPTLGANAFTFQSGKATYKIYVPAESLETYKSAERWSYYADRIQAIV